SGPSCASQVKKNTERHYSPCIGALRDISMTCARAKKNGEPCGPPSFIASLPHCVTALLLTSSGHSDPDPSP
ncbi:hypothetical protein ABTE71_20750, partial [Acinetobacter baumannii]